MSDLNLEQARFNMVEQQVRPWDVLDNRVLDVLQALPREAFVPEAYRNVAYADMEIPLGHGESMMAPKIDGRILQALGIQPHELTLEIGTGSGFLTACMAKLAGEVHSVDIYEDFKYLAMKNLAEQGIQNTVLRTADAKDGWGLATRYDAIAVTASMPEYRPVFEPYLALNGRLFVVVGEAPVMTARLITRVGEHEFATTDLFETNLKAMIGLEQKPEFVF
jgi:protein-L-isoaspartate(D-aspartate) O-methyltransferase